MNQDANPFRPNSELYREADEVVNLIKQGRLTPNSSPICDESMNKISETKKTVSLNNEANDSWHINKKKNKKDKKQSKGEEIEEIKVNKSLVPEKDPSYAEHVLLPENEKMKKKSTCCTIQ